MRSSVAYLVVLMAMLAGFASVRTSPLGLLPFPANWALSAVLLAGAVMVALRRPRLYSLGLAAALCTSLGGLLSQLGWLGVRLPGHPVVWIVAGLYIAFRLTMNRHAEAEARLRKRERAPL